MNTLLQLSSVWYQCFFDNMNKIATVKFRLQLQQLIGLLRLRVGFVLAVIESFKTASDCPFHQMICMHVRKGNLWISENRDFAIPLMFAWEPLTVQRPSQASNTHEFFKLEAPFHCTVWRLHCICVWLRIMVRKGRSRLNLLFLQFSIHI